MQDDAQNILTRDLIKEKRSDRRWRNIRSFLWAAIIIAYAVLIFGPSKFSSSSSTNKDYAAVVELNGSIMPGNPFSVEKALPVLKEAFADKTAKGVILLMDSPGGSAAQASIIHDRLVQLRQQYNKKVIVVGLDTLASGAYLVASAADKIYVNRDTLTGSIGVILSSFGFVDAIQKLGVTRRVFTAGDNKDRLDPFLTMTPNDEAKIKMVLTEVHQNFIDDVKKGRGTRLKGTDTEIFSGDFWSGQTAVKLGLVDGTSDLWSVLKNEFNVTHYKTYSPRKSLSEMLFKGMSSELNFGLTEQKTLIKEQVY
jgi:protease-4